MTLQRKDRRFYPPTVGKTVSPRVGDEFEWGCATTGNGGRMEEETPEQVSGFLANCGRHRVTKVLESGLVRTICISDKLHPLGNPCNVNQKCFKYYKLRPKTILVI